MELTKKQIEGLNIAVERYKKGQKYTVISGFAGTGKSTLVQHIIAALGVDSEDVIYCAYTGKATLVLSRKGCKHTSTLHKLLYKAHLMPNGTWRFMPRGVLEYPYKVVVIDEVSMLPIEMWMLLKKHQVHILALGDPGQLGPVKSTNDSGLLKEPHVFLDQIMRQEEGNEIIHLSMEIRKGFPLKEFQGNQVQIINKHELTTGMLGWADQILCAKNDTRFHLNSQMRTYQQRGEEPEVGDKIICLHNYWETISVEEGDPLVNGTLGWITSVEKYYQPRINIEVLRLSFITELGDFYTDINVDYGLLVNNKSSLTKTDFVKLTRRESTRGLLPKEFAYGSAITTWKSQGSEWDNILLFEENFPWDINEHKRYLYTGVTRASQKIVVVKK